MAVALVVGGDEELAARDLAHEARHVLQQDGARAPLAIRGGGLRGIDYEMPVGPWFDDAEAQVRADLTPDRSEATGWTRPAALSMGEATPSGAGELEQRVAAQPSPSGFGAAGGARRAVGD